MEAKANDFKVGDRVIGMLSWQEFAVIDAKMAKLVRPTALSFYWLLLMCSFDVRKRNFPLSL